MCSLSLASTYTCLLFLFRGAFTPGPWHHLLPAIQNYLGSMGIENTVPGATSSSLRSAFPGSLLKSCLRTTIIPTRPIMCECCYKGLSSSASQTPCVHIKTRGASSSLQSICAVTEKQLVIYCFNDAERTKNERYCAVCL